MSPSFLLIKTNNVRYLLGMIDLPANLQHEIPEAVSRKVDGVEARSLTRAWLLDHLQEVPHVEFAAFTTVEADAAEELFKLRGYLNLSGITSLSNAAAQALGAHRGVLDLSGLTELSDEVARALSRQKGGLWLNGLISISDVAAQALSEHEGDLYLRGLATLSDEGAKALAQHRYFLGFGSLKVISQAGVKTLEKHKGYGLPVPVAAAKQNHSASAAPERSPSKQMGFTVR